jgi:catechol 2,3-dioxygenase-like lactoylglutathione lyase family enzyme
VDHVVLWVADPLAAVAFYESVVGLAGERVAGFRAGKAPFPSVRVSEGCIVDLMVREAAPLVDEIVAPDGGAAGSAGHPLNHLCLAVSAADFDALRARLDAAGVEGVTKVEEGSFGARGGAARSFYFRDPDGNVLEARHYAE